MSERHHLEGKCRRKEHFKWKAVFALPAFSMAPTELRVSRCVGFTQSLSHPVCRSVKWTCRLLNTYRNEENIHIPKQQPRTHTRWRKLFIYQIFIRCKCELKMMVLSPNTCFPAGLPSSCLPPVFLHAFPFLNTSRPVRYEYSLLARFLARYILLFQ